MSTTTVSYATTQDDSGSDYFRALQAAQRKAARAEAQRAERERQRQEKERLRIERAHQQVAAQEEIFQRAVARLDEAARHLPDLTLTAPSLPELREDVASDIEQLEAYATTLEVMVKRFGLQLGTAINQAEEQLRRRKAKAESWQRIADMEQQYAQLTQVCTKLAHDLDQECKVDSLRERPHSAAGLEEVLACEMQVRASLDSVNELHVHLCDRAAARARATGLAGPKVTVRDARTALNEFEVARREAARAQLLQHRDKQLRAYDVAMEQLPSAVRGLIEHAVDEAHMHDRSDRISAWIRQESQRRDGIAMAMKLMQCPPEMVHDEPALARRWNILSDRLQRIASGLEAFVPEVDHEYAQLQNDANCFRKAACGRVNLVTQLRGQGYEVYERGDDQGMVVVDLDNPDVHLLLTEHAAEGGGTVSVMELMADSAAVDDAKVTEDACKRLANAAAQQTPGMTTKSEVLERKQRLSRAPRPVKKMEQPFQS